MIMIITVLKHVFKIISSRENQVESFNVFL